MFLRLTKVCGNIHKLVRFHCLWSGRQGAKWPSTYKRLVFLIYDYDLSNETIFDESPPGKAAANTLLRLFHWKFAIWPASIFAALLLEI